jgi:hypothetical protein
MRRLLLAILLLSVPIAGWCQAPSPGSAKPAKAPPVSPYAGYVGDWVAVLDGKVWLLLQLDLHGEKLTGWLTHPHDLEVNDEGGLKSVSEEKVKETITDAALNPDGLLLTVRFGDEKEPDHYMMRLTEPGKEAELKMVAMNMPPGMPKPKPWKLMKFPASSEPAPH